MAQKIKGIEIDGTLYEFDTGLPSIAEQEGGVLDESFEFASDDGSDIYVKITPKGLYAKQLYVGTGSSAKTVQQLINAAVASSGGGGGGAARRSVKIICFGNSFTQDSMSYVPTILKNICPQIDFVIGVAYIGGCPLAQHYVNFYGGSETVNSLTYTPKDYDYFRFDSSADGWVSASGKTAIEILQAEEWDIVTFQEGGVFAHLDWEVCYEPYIYGIHKAVFDNVSNKSVKLGWLSIHGTYSSTQQGDLDKFNKVIANSKKVMDLTGTEILFPFGTAVQNLRTTPLKELGDYDTHNLKYDVAHLQEGIGCLVAAYANTLTILNAIGYGNISIVGDTTRPDNTWSSQKLVIGAHGSTIGITENNAYCAQIAAIQAVKNPYEITDCNKFYNS